MKRQAKEKIRLMNKKVILGRILEIDNISKFCKEYNLSRCGIHNLLHEKISDYKGYKVKK